MVAVPELCSCADGCYRCCRCCFSASATVWYSLPVVFLNLGAEAWTPEFRRPRHAREIHLRPALFWDFTEQRKMVGHYRRFGTICLIHLQESYRSHIQGSCLTLDMGRAGCPETSVRNYVLGWVKSQNNSYLLYTATEDWNRHPHWSASLCVNLCEEEKRERQSLAEFGRHCWHGELKRFVYTAQKLRRSEFVLL